MFPSLIANLCRRAWVKEYVGDKWVSFAAPIYPLSIQGEGTPSKAYKRMINLGKLACIEPESHRPFTTRPLEILELILHLSRILCLVYPREREIPPPHIIHMFHVSFMRSTWRAKRSKDLPFLGLRKPAAFRWSHILAFRTCMKKWS